jgi:hypothetical protein
LDNIQNNFFICSENGDIVISLGFLLYMKKGSGRWIRIPEKILPYHISGIEWLGNDIYLHNDDSILYKYNPEENTVKMLKCPGRYINSMAVFKNGYIGVVVSDSGYYLSKDDGLTFKKIDLGIDKTEIRNYIYSFKTKNEILYFFSEHNILCSSDYGEHWNLIKHFDNNYQQSPPYYVTEDGYIFTFYYYSTNNGATFREYENDSISYGKYNIIVGPDRRAYASTWNTGVCKSSEKIIADVNEKTNLINNELSISPNPASDNISISFPGGFNQSIHIYNSLGIEIKRFDAKDLFGKNSINISMEGFPSGMYYVKQDIQSFPNFGCLTKSFVVIR